MKRSEGTAISSRVDRDKVGQRTEGGVVVPYGYLKEEQN